jgi:teichuronic acid biosynthesis glycosyltransferase TuaC
MKVCILTTSYPAYKGHIQSPFVYKLTEALKESKLDVDVVCPFYKGSKKEENWTDIRIHRFKYAPFVFMQKLTQGGGIPSALKRSFLAKLQMPFFILSFYLRSKKYVKECDVIHAQWALSALIGVFLKKRYHKPLILTERGASANLAVKNKLMKMVFKWVLKNCDFITANNENQIEIMGSLGVSDAKLKAVPNGFDLNSFKPRNKVKTRAKLGLAQDKKIILFVGWLIERKGLNYLLDSMSQIKNQNALLLVIGEGLLELKLKEYTKKLGISDQVKFLGSKHPDELPYWMNASDILVLPSLSEGRPNVVGEAMASGLPVIASNVNGTPEFIEDGQNGFLVPAKDSKAITEKLLKLLDSEEMRFDIGKKAHESIIEKKLTWENCASNYRNIYNKIL